MKLKKLLLFVFPESKEGHFFWYTKESEDLTKFYVWSDWEVKGEGHPLLVIYYEEIQSPW